MIPKIVFPDEVDQFPHLKLLLGDFHKTKDFPSAMEELGAINKYLSSQKRELHADAMLGVIDHFLTLPAPAQQGIHNLSSMLSKMKHYMLPTAEKAGEMVNVRCIISRSSSWLEVLSDAYPEDMMRCLLEMPEELEEWLAQPNTPLNSYETMSRIIVQGFLSPRYRGTDRAVVKTLGKIAHAHPEAMTSSISPEFFAQLSPSTLSGTDGDTALGMAAIRRALLREMSPKSVQTNIPSRSAVPKL